MGRVSLEKRTYDVNNTLVELAPADDGVHSNKGTPALKPGESPEIQASSFMPQTPSPFMGAQPDPYQMQDSYQMPYPMMDQSQMGVGMPSFSFGDFGIEDTTCMQGGYNLVEAPAFGPSFQYDPNTGTYIAYDYTYMQQQYDPNIGCYMMQEPMQEERASEDRTQALLSALQEKIGEDQVNGTSEATLDMNMAGGNMVAVGEMEAWDNNGNAHGWTTWEDEQLDSMDGQQMQQPGRRRADRRDARESGCRQEHTGAENWEAEGHSGSGSQEVVSKGASQWGAQANRDISGDTTVMFRNIPNKYTREMLVSQLEEDMPGLFDFIYLPIDFKNRCNVGYAFINFRTTDAYQSFVSRFNGVEVRKCLPGLNSRKITEVTPARVQGFEENVARLRNSPVMRELIHKPEWMPLIFDYNGEQIPFPSPERPLEPIKPRRRARDDESRR